MRWALLFVFVGALFAVTSADGEPSLDIKARTNVFEVNEGIALYCEGSNLGAEQMEWIDNNGKVVEYKRGRVNVERPNTKKKLALLVLLVKPLELTDEGTWTCRTKDLSLQKTYNVTVGEKVEIDGEEKQVANENSMARLKCQILKGVPQPEVQWYKNNIGSDTEILPSQKGEVQKYVLNKEKGKNIYSLTIKKLTFDDDATYICRATQKKLSHHATKFMKLDVRYKPIFIHPEMKTILPNRDEPGTPYEMQHVFAVLNYTKNITCNVIANPTAKFKWVKIKNSNNEEDIPEDSIISLDDDTSILQLNMEDKNDAGQYKCTASNTLGSSNLIIEVMLGENPVSPDTIIYDEEGSNSTHMAFTVSCGNCTFSKNPDFPNLDPSKLPVIGYSFQLKTYVEDFIPDWDHSEEIIVPITSENDTLFYVGPLSNSTKFHVRVRSVNDAGFSDWLPLPFTDADHLPFTKHSVRLASTVFLLALTLFIFLMY